MPKEVYVDRYSFIAHWYLLHILKEPYSAWCQFTTTDVYENKIQGESSEIKPMTVKDITSVTVLMMRRLPTICIYI